MAAECQSDPALWRFAYPNAKAVVSINWQRIRLSAAGAMIRDKWLNTGSAVPIPGMEIIEDIDRVLISSPGNLFGPDADGDSGEPSVLFVVQGHFEAAKVHQFFTRLGTKAQSYNSFQVYRPQEKGAKNMAYVLFDAGTILFGDAPSIFAALERNRFTPPTPEPGSIVARAAEMDAAYDFWLVMNSPEMMSSDRLAGLFRGAEWVSEAQGFEAGVSLRTGLAADVTVRLASEEAAKRVVTEITRLTAMVLKDKKAEAQLQDVAKKLKLNADGSVVKISLRLTPKELEKSAQSFAAGLKASSATPVPAAVVPDAVPAKPGVIRIEGLDEGAREIPYPPPQP
jgi:hypothetical protein